MRRAMAYGCFTDKADCPDLERAARALAGSHTLWDALTDELRRHTRARPSWRFYGRNYGWALAFKKGGRALAALFPDDECLTVLVVLTGTQADQALAGGELGDATRVLIASLPRFKEGCWVFVRVAGPADLDDARRLVASRAA
jgi:Protein of unknown function (DUF3788)